MITGDFDALEGLDAAVWMDIGRAEAVVEDDFDAEGVHAFEDEVVHGRMEAREEVHAGVNEGDVYLWMMGCNVRRAFFYMSA